MLAFSHSINGWPSMLITRTTSGRDY